MRRLKQEEGLVLVLVAGLLVVLLGMAALAIDLGALYSERRQLRNGADAAALAVAEDCGRHPASCTQGAAATAQMYANANADDGASGVTVDLTSTGSDTGSVHVVTSAFDSTAGVPVVRVPLMSLFGFDRVGVTASATAIFDHPASASALPLAVDACEYYKAGGFGASIELPWQEDPTSDSSPCTSHPSLSDFTGGFGWLRPSGGCTRVLTAGTWFAADPGGAPGCLALGQDILVPLFSDVDEANGTYLVSGFAFFHPTGYRLAGGITAPSGFVCDTGSYCLQGYFTPGSVYAGEPSGADFGVVLVKLVQ